MILPIYIYGHPILRKKAKVVDVKYKDDVQSLIQNMWETMYNAKGVGLAAPQIGKSLRLFIVDTLQLTKEDLENNNPGIKRAFINVEVIDQGGDLWIYEEGCLSIPKLVGDVERPETITIKYLNHKFEEITESFDGMNARVIQHEYDHIEGKLFTERLKPIKKKLLVRKLDQIKKGKVKAEYKIFIA